MRHCNNTQYLMWSVVFDRANRLECVETESLESGQIYITVRLFAYNSLDLRMLPVVQYTHPRGLTTRGLGSGAHPYTPAGYTTFYSAPTYPGNCGTCCHARPALWDLTSRRRREICADGTVSWFSHDSLVSTQRSRLPRAYHRPLLLCFLLCSQDLHLSAFCMLLLPQPSVHMLPLGQYTLPWDLTTQWASLRRALAYMRRNMRQRVQRNLPDAPSTSTNRLDRLLMRSANSCGPAGASMDGLQLRPAGPCGLAGELTNGLLLRLAGPCGPAGAPTTGLLLRLAGPCGKAGTSIKGLPPRPASPCGLAGALLTGLPMRLAGPRGPAGALLNGWLLRVADPRDLAGSLSNGWLLRPCGSTGAPTNGRLLLCSDGRGTDKRMASALLCSPAKNKKIPFPLPPFPPANFLQ